jgi:hypothetical protein
MSPPKVDSASVVQRQVDAYNVHDLDAFAATYSDEAAYLRFPSGEITMAGLSAIREAFGELFSNHPRVHVAIQERMTLGRFVIDHEVVTGRTDVPVAFALAIYEVGAGRIQRVWLIRG